MTQASARRKDIEAVYSVECIVNSECVRLAVDGIKMLQGNR